MLEMLILICGWLQIALALLHLGMPRYFNWSAALSTTDLLTRQLFYVHTFFVALTVLLIGVLSVGWHDELLNSSLGTIMCYGIAGFWGIRASFQWFIYSPKLWRGKRLETLIHVLFSMLWVGLTTVYFLAA